jgi:hypothetical protein
MSSPVYQKIDVWKRSGPNQVLRFQCLQRLPDGQFAVQNTDYIRDCSSARLHESDRQFVELFLEEDPGDRCSWFSTLEEAIRAHEAEFASMPGHP